MLQDDAVLAGAVRAGQSEERALLACAPAFYTRRGEKSAR
jgi:hypothetical protein